MKQLGLLVAVLLLFVSAHAQVEEQIDESVQFAEDQLDKEDQELEQIQNLQKAREKVDYSNVKETTPYSDMVTIQKTMLPKSQRFRVMGGISFLPNDVFFTTFGLDARLGYDFSESFGTEVGALFLTSKASEDLKEVESQQRVAINNLSSLKSFWGASVVFTPFYGKTALNNSRIIPFEIYQSIGIGKVDAGNSSQATAIKVGVGELFSWDNQRAMRLELSFLFYKSKTIANTDQNSNVMLLTIGFENFLTKVGGR